MTTVLVAEDDEELLEMYDLWFDRLPDLSVRTATDGREALDLLDDAVDVAVLDRGMPETSGGEVARTIESTYPGCSVIVVSAYRPDDHIEEDDYDHYLTKPIRRDELLDAVEREASVRVAVDQ